MFCVSIFDKVKASRFNGTYMAHDAQARCDTLIVNLQQTMTSLEIAELTGKQHFHVMEAIRKMEPAWKKVCKSNFRLTSRTIVQPNGGTREVPCYQLTKTECLYIATKFNDASHGARHGVIMLFISSFSIFLDSCAYPRRLQCGGYRP